MPIFESKDLDSTVIKTKGTDIYNSMLIGQYQESPNLKAYAGAFLAEFDLLFEEVEKVYLGRFLEYATYEQLNVLGLIVGISRELSLTKDFFGFLSSLGSGGFGTVSDAEEGDIFRSKTLQYDTIQLQDDLYRRVVRAKAMCNGAKFHNVDFMYEIITILYGKVPSVIKLKADDNKRIITLTLKDAETDPTVVNLILAMKQHFVPTGIRFDINLI